MTTDREVDQLRTQIDELNRELVEAKEALRAIRSGEVDALVVQTSDGNQVFTLEGAYEPYRVFLEHMEQGAVALLPDGLVLYCNQRFADILGVPSEHVLGASIYELIGVRHRAVLEQLLGATARGKRDAEMVIERADGIAIHVYIHLTEMPDGTRCAVFTDVTDRVRQRELLASEQWLRVTLSSIGDAVLSCDVTGRLTFMNPVAEALTGWSSAEALGQPIQQVFRIVDEHTNEPSEDVVGRVLREGRAVVLASHIALERRDGRKVQIEDTAAPIKDDGGVAGAIVVFHDVTERRQARRALEKSEARLGEVLGSITEGYYALDSAWCFVSANPVTARHFGRSARQLIGRNIWDLSGSAPDSIQYQKFHDAASTRRAVHFEARSFVRPDHWAELHVYPRDGGVEVYFTDISKRKQAEESLRLALRELEEAKASAERARAAAEEASRAKDHFLAVLSHELRTPLSPVLTGVTLLAADDGLSRRAKEIVDVIRRNVGLEVRLIDDLLDLVRVARNKIRLEKRRVDLRSVIAGAVEVCGHDIDARGLKVDVDSGDRAWMVNGDPARLQQVVWNLLKNAIKFTPNAGCIAITCREENGQAVLEVKDSGIGIEPDAIPRLFDAFAQAEASIGRQFGGLGLGLAISKALVELHGGTIDAVSEGRHRGSSFRVRLPLAGEPRTSLLEASSGTGVARPTNLRILLVDDHADTVEIVTMVLESRGHEVRRAADVAAALEAAAEGDFDLILSDLGLPDRSGLELMQELRARGSEVPGIALSGYGQPADIEQSRAAGFSEHLVKPADPASLLATIEKVTSGRNAR